MAKNSKGAKLLDELVIKVNSRALKQAVKDQDQLYSRMEDSAQGAELLNEQLGYTNIQLQEARQLSRGLANNLEGLGSDKNTQVYFDSVVAALQDIEGVVNDLQVAFEEYSGIARKGNDEVVVALEDLLDPLRKVDKQTGKAQDGLEELGKAGTGAGQGTDKARKGTEGASRAAKNSTRAFQDLAKVAGPVPMLYATIAANIYAITAAYDQLAAGDRLNRLEKINSLIGAEQGVAVSQLANIMQEATGYAIGFDNAMLKAAQASAYGFSSEQVEEFTLAARRASVALGVDLDDQLNRIIRGVSKQEVELLDELGITVRLTEAYQTYQEQLNISQTSLSGFQKQQAYANAVIAESTKRFGYLGDAIKATPWERLQAGTDQSVKSGQKWLAKFLEPAAEALAKVLEKDQLSKYQDGIAAVNAAQAQAVQKGDVLQAAALQQEALEKGNKDLEGKRQKLLELQELERTGSFGAGIGDIFSGQKQKQQRDNAEAINQLTTEIKAQQQSLKQLSSESLNLSGSQQDINKQLGAMAIHFRQIQQLGKSLPETVSKFNQSIQTPQAPTQELSDQLKQSIDEYKYLQTIADKKASITSSDNFKASTEAKATQQKILADQGVKSFSTLVVLQEKAQDAAKVYNTYLKNSTLTQAQLAKTFQFQSGVTDQLKSNQQQTLEIDEQLKQNEFEISKGVEHRTLSEKEVLELKAKKLDLERANLDLTRQQNDIETQQQVTLSEIQATKQVMSNQDPIIQGLKQVNDELKQQYANLQKNKGIMKPEDRIQQEKVIGDLLQKQRDLEQQKQSRANDIVLAKQEQAKYEYILAKQGSDRNVEDIQELDFLAKKDVYLKEQLRIAQKYGNDQATIQSIKTERAQNSLAVQTAKQGIVEQQQQDYEAILDQRSRMLGLSEVDSLNLQVEAQEEYLKLLNEQQAKQQIIIAQEAKLTDLRIQQQNAKKQEQARVVNQASGVLGSQGSVPLIQAPTAPGEQQQKEQQTAASMDVLNKSFSELSQYNPAMSDMIANVSNLGLAFQQMGEGADIGQQVAVAGMSTVASLLNMSSQQTISGIDDQIAAEKARDGKSQESVKKIQKLEAEKAQQQKKAQVQQIVMQTAMGITGALQMTPWTPANFVLAGAVATMGLQSLKSQQSGTSVPSVAEASVPSLSLGERDNRVDVSKSASAGELSYIQGGNGVGNASNFKPRQVGNRQPQNHSVMVGENGPEVVSFDTPGTVTQQNKANKGQGEQGQTNIQIVAMDSESFQQFLARNSKAVTSTVEFSLNNEGRSLYG